MLWVFVRFWPHRESGCRDFEFFAVHYGGNRDCRVVISFVSLQQCTGKVQRQQLRLQTKQEELTVLQLDALRKQAAAPQAPLPLQEKADVRIDLEGQGQHFRFVITNWVAFRLEASPSSLRPKRVKRVPSSEATTTRSYPSPSWRLGAGAR